MCNKTFKPNLSYLNINCDYLKQLIKLSVTILHGTDDHMFDFSKQMQRFEKR